ncbi:MULTISPECIES: ATP-binding protein [unclassified Mesorhizobium]|uniref:AAA family ATPase n=1 Tax=unclassified Mesorhizobium TaxID=325217 RepID=UPI000428FF05|nr:MULTISPECIES: ATP-binding protein [unclassified Mesorhizobium]WJI81501.1 ATP-binding protein [Mesorhizobium sp. C374B]WJI88020.1 ATP-binding protein [Mesorhizobium sp. C372A]
MNEPTKVNRPAPLKNVAAFATLLQTMVERDPKLPGLGAFFSPSGWGKTESAIYGANRYRAAYVECGQFTTARSLLCDILRELGEPNPRGTIEDLKNKAIMVMVSDPRRPLIIDEAHFIAHKRFVDLMRELSDKSGAPVIMIGEENLPRLLEAFERVHNRVLEWLPAVPCDAVDFELLVKNRCNGVTVAPDLAAAILDKTKGNTRRIVINLATVTKVAQLTGATTVDLGAFGGAGVINATPKFSARRAA